MTASAFAALALTGTAGRCEAGAGKTGYGALVPDPEGLLDLPRRFSYRVISRLGDRMDDGLAVPDNADGMGCFARTDGLVALVRNHELRAGADAGGSIVSGYDRNAAGKVLPGGTMTILLDPVTLEVKRQYRSLAGTIRNCAGGTTPWGSWLTCEEDVSTAGGNLGKDHGWVFEVPADAGRLVDAHPLKAMGRFNHEAACVDPASGIVYMTEDREDGLLYRFIPVAPGRLAMGGKLQALALEGVGNTRNRKVVRMAPGQWLPAKWVDLDDVESPQDDLRQRGASAGATRFSRGEGIHMGEGELYFCCTSGGAKGLGQVFRLGLGGDGSDRVQLFYESTSPDEFNFGDNLTIAPNGHLVVCEDQYTDPVDNHLRGIGPDGRAYPLARLHRQTELAGACFSPDGHTLFLNLFSPAMTLAIRGPWAS